VLAEIWAGCGRCSRSLRRCGRRRSRCNRRRGRCGRKRHRLTDICRETRTPQALALDLDLAQAGFLEQPGKLADEALFGAAFAFRVFCHAFVQSRSPSWRAVQPYRAALPVSRSAMASMASS
jgi:hypothetical protein